MYGEDDLPIYDGLTEEQREKANQKYIAELPEKIENDPVRYLKRFGVPSKYMGASLTSFDGGSATIKLCWEYLKQPSGDIFITGECGSGKTHIACAILRELAKADKKAFFVSVPELLMELRVSFKDGATQSESDIINRYVNMPFLVLDDLGAEKTTEYSITSLYLIIDKRINDERPTVITTNLSLGQVEDVFGSRIASRLSGYKLWKLDMPDFRKGK